MPRFPALAILICGKALTALHQIRKLTDRWIAPPGRALEDLSKLEPGDEVTARVKDLRRRMKRAVAPMDYYAVLGVSSGSTAADIKVSYRKLAMRFHPDRPGCNQGVIFQYISQVKAETPV